MVIEQILSHQLSIDFFNDKTPDFSAGLAQRAVDFGFDSLSTAQKSILEPFLTQHCSGHTDPGGHHNDCDKTLSGDDLLKAYLEADDPECLMCEDCHEEAIFQERQREKFFRD